MSSLPLTTPPATPAPAPDPDTPAGGGGTGGGTGDGTTGGGIISSLNGNLPIQVGSDADPTTNAIYVDTTLELDTSGIDVMTSESSALAIEKIDSLINIIAQKRASFGVVMNHLEAIIDSNTVTIENLTAAKSTIMDADMAKETTDYVRNNILTQTSSTLLSQAGQMNNNAILMLVQGM